MGLFAVDHEHIVDADFRRFGGTFAVEFALFNALGVVVVLLFLVVLDVFFGGSPDELFDLVGRKCSGRRRELWAGLVATFLRSSEVRLRGRGGRRIPLSTRQRRLQ